MAFSRFNSLLVISGAFGRFLKSAVLAVGGYRRDTVGEDMELVVRLHRWALESKRPYRIAFQPDPVCWTEVPETLTILRRQRSRWQRGTIETVWLHKRMIANPAYGALGLFAFPYFVLFEMLGPLVETSGYLLTALGFSFRQLLTIWRAQAFVDLLRGNRSWGAMERTGFQKPALPPIA